MLIGYARVSTDDQRIKDLVEQFNVKPAEIRALFANQLDPTRTANLRAEFQMAGLPI